MAGNFKMPNKKTTIIVGIIIAILAIIAITGTVVFLKDRGSTEAADLNSEQVSREETRTSSDTPNEQASQSTTTENNGEVAGNQDGQNAGVAQSDATANAGTTNAGTTTGGTTGTTTTTTTAGATGTTTTADNIQGTTITRTEQVQIPERQISEGHYVGWTPMSVNAVIASANITAKTDEIEVEKTGNETVAQGDEVTYVITVTNKTEETLNKIEVKDRLDGTILDTTTVKFVTEAGEEGNTINWTKNGTVNGNVITWNVDIEPGKTVKITFKATVKTNVAEGTILKNSVIANGKEIEAPVETKIEEATKKITVIKEWAGEGNEAGSVRPSDVTINLENGAKAELTSANAVTGNANQWSKEVEVDKYDEDGKELTYGYASETSTDTNKFASYTKTGLDTSVADTVKVINEYKAPEVTDEVFTKDGTTTITSKDEELTYTISYSSVVKNYKGNATLTIVDTLPYAIDTTKSDLQGGNYDANAKTITWTEIIEGIDTYANGEKKIEVSKTIKVVYVGMDVTSGTFKNIAQGTLKFDETGKEDPTEPVEEETTRDFKKDIKVIKVWSGDEDEAEKVRPSDITINLTEGKSITLNASNANAENANIWEGTIQDVDKYNSVGSLKEYNYTGETSTNSNKLASYTATQSKQEGAEEDTITVTNEYKAPEVTDEVFTKDGTTTITSKDEELTYTISYSSVVKDYKGNATLTIVDTLPYAIDTTKSDIKGGTYDANAKTITWTETIEGIDTFANGEKKIEVSKTIKVVYVGMDVTSGTFKNTAQGTLKFDETGKEDPTEPVEEETTRDFKKDIKVIKVWSGDEDEAEKVRPSDITINLTEGKSITLNASNANAENANIWEGTIEDVDKYNTDGSLKEYNYTGETSTNSNKLASYTATSSKQEDTITVRNTYKAPEVTDKTLTKTGTGKITSKDEKVNYTITYGAKVKDYKGKVIVTVVDTLPYAIDTAKSELDDGIYNANAKTITWTEEIDVDTFASNEDYVIDFSKNIEVVYVGMNTDTTTEPKLINTVNATVTLDTIGEDITTTPVTHETEKDFKKQITVKKFWERDSESVRPANVTINITDGKSAVLTSNGTNTWEATIEVDKYDAQGNDKTYSYVSESSTDREKLANYTETVADDTSEKDVIKVTNKYKTIDVSGTKTWDDVNDEKGERPSSITLQLMQSVNGAQATEVANGEKTVNAPAANQDGTISNTWGYTFENLPEFDENGNKITYSVVEKNVKTGYTATPDGMNVTNYYPVDKVTTTKSSEVVSCVNGATEHAKTENSTGAAAKYTTIVHEEDEIKYTITIANIGNKTTTVNINDPIKTGLTYDNGEITATLSGAETDKNAPAVAGLIQNNVLSLQNYEIDKGVTLTITFVVKVDTLPEDETATSGTITNKIDKNVATITNNGTTTTPSDETEYEVKKANITGTKTVSLEKAGTGDTLTYTITATNNSDEEGKLIINDDLSQLISEGKIENVRNVKVNGVEKPECYANNKITYTDEHFAAHATVTLTFDATVKETALGSTFTNIAKVNNRDYSATTKVVKKVYSTAKTDKPIDLVLVLDISGSMDSENRLSNMQTASKSMIEQLFPEGKETDSTVSLITFSSSANTIITAEGQSQKQAIKTSIEGLNANGGTNINAALKQANALLSSGILKNEDKVVVFLSDGAPTQPFYILNGNKGDWGTQYGDYSQNTEANIIAQATRLQSKATVYSIGLGIDKLANNRDSNDAQRAALYTLCPNMKTINVTSMKSYTITRDGEEISGNVASSGDVVNYTITLTNNSDETATVKVTENAGSTDDIEISNISNNGTRSNGTITWNNVEIPANGTVTLTYQTTVKYGRKNKVKEVTLTTEGTTVEQQMTGCGVEICIKANDGNYYHWESEQSYARRLLRDEIASSTSKYKEAADGAGNLQSVFDQIFKEMHEETATHYIEEPLASIVTVSETRKLVGDTVQVKIGDDDTNIQTYQISDLSTGEGIDGIKYTEGVGFTWTVTEAHRNDRLELIYTCEEAK